MKWFYSMKCSCMLNRKTFLNIKYIISNNNQTYLHGSKNIYLKMAKI